MAKREKIASYTLEFVKSLVQMLVLFIFLLVFARPSLIVGESMHPTLQDKNVILTEKISFILRTPKKGDIVSASSNLRLNDYMNKRIIKRIIGVPGDHVVVREGEVYLNDKKLEENYINDGFTNGYVDIIVPKDKYFVMGDNRLRSNDSRFEVGLLDKKDILNKAYFRIFPFNEIGVLQ